MWRGRPLPRLPVLVTGFSREPEPLSRTSATLIPSAEVPLITPATIIASSLIAVPAAYLPSG